MRGVVGRQKLGASLPGQLAGALVAPGGDLFVVPASQHLGDLVSAKDQRAGVVRVFEQPSGVGAVGFFPGRFFISENPREQANHALQNRHGGDFSAGHDEISERDLFVHVTSDAGVRALVATADQHQGGARAQLDGLALVQRGALRGEQDTVGALTSLGVEGFHGVHQAIDAHDHAAATAVRSVIDAAMLPEPEISGAAEACMENA